MYIYRPWRETNIAVGRQCQPADSQTNARTFHKLQMISITQALCAFGAIWRPFSLGAHFGCCYMAICRIGPPNEPAKLEYSKPGMLSQLWRQFPSCSPTPPAQVPPASSQRKRSHWDARASWLRDRERERERGKRRPQTQLIGKENKSKSLSWSS